MPKLDRIGRSMEDCVSRVAELLDRGCHLGTLDGRVDTLVLGKIAEADPGAHRGRPAARLGGWDEVHSYMPAQAEHVKEMAAHGLPHRKVAAMVSGLFASTVRRILQEA